MLRLKTIAKIAGTLLGVVGLAMAGGAGYLQYGNPAVRAASTEVVERTPERLARGTYLAEHLLACVSCHSNHDVTLYGLPVVDGVGAGGLVFTRALGLPGEIQPPNITPDLETGVGAWTDGELMRAIREGIGKDGQALFPMMPYKSLRSMSDEDLRSLIVYLRALPAVKRETPKPDIDFPVSLFIRAVPKPVVEPVAAPDPAADPVAYGGYLVGLAGCKGCHTPMDGKGQAIAGREFAGGREFPLTWENGKLGPRVVTANITTDPETGYFGRTTKADWIARVRSNASLADARPTMTPGTNTLMPWIEFSGLTEQDLGAIYDYMKTVPPVYAKVVSFPDAAP